MAIHHRTRYDVVLMIEPFDAYYTSVPQRSLRAFAGLREPKLMDLLRALLADPLEAEDLAAKKRRRTDYALDRFRDQGSKAVDAALQTASLWLLKQKDGIGAIGVLARWEPWLSIWCGCGVVRSVESTLPKWVKDSVSLLEDVISSGGYNDSPSDDPAVSSKLELVKSARGAMSDFDTSTLSTSDFFAASSIEMLLTAAIRIDLETSTNPTNRPSYWIVRSMDDAERILRSNPHFTDYPATRKKIAQISRDRVMTFPMR